MSDMQLLSDNDAQQALTIANLIYNPEMYQRLEQMAELLCAKSGMVPEHLREKIGDMMAIIIQSSRWNLDPLMVAQCTFVLNGVIGYEAKLIQSIAKSNGGIVFTGEYYGDWDNIVGNTQFKTVTKQGKYGNYNTSIEIPNWQPIDEKDVGYVITGHWPNGDKMSLDIPLVTCKPRHSTNWTHNPKQQIHYTGVKRWVRQFVPHLAIGVKDYDDLSSFNEKEVNSRPNAKTTSSPQHFFKLDKVDELHQLIRSIHHETDIYDVKQYIQEAMDADEINADEHKKLHQALNIKKTTFWGK